MFWGLKGLGFRVQGLGFRARGICIYTPALGFRGLQAPTQLGLRVEVDWTLKFLDSLFLYEPSVLSV